MVDNPSAPPGKATKYARHEHERRFLLAEIPPGDADLIIAIHDRYITDTRLRLRRMEQVQPVGPTVFKLTQKVANTDGGAGLITNIYLTESEYDVLTVLPAATLTKTRHHISPLAVDVFGGELAGLVLAEAEFDTAAQCADFTPPEFVVQEVTDDPRFTGGVLAVTDAAALTDLLGDLAPPASRKR